MVEQTDVVVVGAGGGGAVLGLALAQKGIQCLILDQASGPPTGLRGEILQPNGQEVLAALGLLQGLPSTMVREVQYFNFFRAGGERLCTINYDMLPPPYNRALVTMPNAVHHLIVNHIEKVAPGILRYQTSVQKLLWEGQRVVGVVADQQGVINEIRAKLVVGADGARSQVRQELGIQADLHLYSHGYLISMLENPEKIDASRYFVGRNSILGIFPAAEGKVYLFYMIPANSLDQIKGRGIESLREEWRKIDPSLSNTFATLRDWNQTAYMPTGRVRAPKWAVDGAVLIGDAAHAMNPHASQGRMQAMVDAMTLANLVEEASNHDEWSPRTFEAFEQIRRPQVEMLQKLADEQVFFWDTGNPIIAGLRDRVFRTLDHNRRLQFQVLETTAGFRQVPPFGWYDRFMAVGLVPDPWSARIPPLSRKTMNVPGKTSHSTWSH